MSSFVSSFLRLPTIHFILGPHFEGLPTAPKACLLHMRLGRYLISILSQSLPVADKTPVQAISLVTALELVQRLMGLRFKFRLQSLAL
jgi:hypothetical protein